MSFCVEWDAKDCLMTLALIDYIGVLDLPTSVITQDGCTT